MSENTTRSNDTNGTIPTSIITCKTMEDLRTTEPTDMGQMAMVLEYKQGYKMGGGLFVYDMVDTTTPHDHGVNIKTPKGKIWKRVLTDHNEVTVVHFGALADGKTDCKQAVEWMWAWSKRVNPTLGIKFPAGKFMLSKFDISAAEVPKFRVAGEHVNFGYYPSTELVSDKKNDVMFTVKARYMEVSSLIIDGESKDGARNTKGFFKNIIPGGQFVRVTSVMFYNMGGRSLDLVDTLDCKIDQWYARDCTGTVVYGHWSGQVQGKWDHITAIELCNFNIQRSTGPNPAIDLQRAGQSAIYNGWIEHTEYPGNISYGQWSIEAFNMETCPNPMRCYRARIVNQQFNVQAGQGFDFDDATGIENWPEMSVYEQGHVDIESHGIKITGSLNYDYLTTPGNERMDNRSDKEKWFYVGELFFSHNTSQARIRIIGSAFYSAMPTTQIDATERTAEGAADIFLQKTGDKSYIATWSGQGSCPVTRVLLQPGSAGEKTRLFVKIAKYTGFCSALLETNSLDRFSAGVHFMFDKAYRAATAEEIALLDAAPDTAFHQHWQGRPAVGYGFNNDNELLMRGKVLNNDQFNASTKHLKVYVNGVAYGLELKPYKG